MRISVSIIGTFFLVISLLGCHPKDKEIAIAVQSQLQLYPNSTLIDIYKSFFQDRFGPGHLVEDSAAARAYFDAELAEMNSRGRYHADPCGAGKQFYRVSLDLVKDGRVEVEVFFRTFMEGAKSFKSPGILDPGEMEAWKNEWRSVVSVIEEINPDLPGFETDKAAIGAMLGRGEFVVHHSLQYRESYDPHYRIIRKDLLYKLGL